MKGSSRCTSDNAATTRTVSPTYTRGFLTAVPGYASAITYHPSGLVNAITHANSVVVTHAADPDAMARPASIAATKGATTYWSTGAYGYDGAGNVTAIGGSYFLYDPVSRLTTGTVSTSSLGTGSLKTQSYTYDAFGNIQSIAGSPGRSTPTSAATNRLTGTAVYDASGNLTSWNGNAYEYDALNMMTRMTSGAEDWLYVYTADDERVWQYKLTSGSPFHRYTLRDLSGQVLREYTSAGDFWTVERDYVYRGGQLLAAQTPAGMRHFHLDHLGTPRLVTNESGQWVAYQRGRAASTSCPSAPLDWPPEAAVGVVRREGKEVGGADGSGSNVSSGIGSYRRDTFDVTDRLVKNSGHGGSRQGISSETHPRSCPGVGPGAGGRRDLVVGWVGDGDGASGDETGVLGERGAADDEAKCLRCPSRANYRPLVAVKDEFAPEWRVRPPSEATRFEITDSDGGRKAPILCNGRQTAVGCRWLPETALMWCRPDEPRTVLRPPRLFPFRAACRGGQGRRVTSLRGTRRRREALTAPARRPTIPSRGGRRHQITTPDRCSFTQPSTVGER